MNTMLMIGRIVGSENFSQMRQELILHVSFLIMLQEMHL